MDNPPTFDDVFPHVNYTCRLEQLVAALVEALKGMEQFAKEFIDDAVGGIPASEFYTTEDAVAKCQAVLQALALVEGDKDG